MPADHVQLPALRELGAATRKLGIDFSALVAEVGLWVLPDIHARNVTPGNPTGAVRKDVRRARLGSGERPGTVVDGVRLDRNNYAGHAIREAIGVPRGDLAGYQACHVWPETCYDARYHTVLANLVLVPAPIVSLTDHDPAVIAALQYRSYELYGWHPVEAARPARPAAYPTNWRGPLARPSDPLVRVPGRPPPAASGGTGSEHFLPRGESQRDVMKRLWARHGGEVDAVVRSWAAAVRSGAAERRSNARGEGDEDYARRLIYDGRRKGWLR